MTNRSVRKAILKADRAILSAVLAAAFWSAGCTTTIQEKKATEADPGNVTQLKFDGQKMKVLHSF